MFKIHANEWFAEKDQYAIDLELCSQVDLTVSAAQWELWAENEKTQVKFMTGQNTYQARFKLTGFDKLIVKAKGEFGLKYSYLTRETEEKRDNLEPPVPVRPTSVLGRMRQEALRSMAIARESFLTEDMDYPNFEVTDDEPLEFEEETAERLKKEKAEAQKEAETATAEEKNLSTTPPSQQTKEAPSDERGNKPATTSAGGAQTGD